MAKKTKDHTATFRRIALSLPEAYEGSHMAHPDFRVPQPKGKIFATLFCSNDALDTEDRGMVKFTPDQQDEFVETHPAIFSPIKGQWGLQGYTQVELSRATAPVLKQALTAAWRNAAPKSLLKSM